jgi:hypothetical protein
MSGKRTVRIASLADAHACLTDQALYGCAFVDSEGRRVRPDHVLVGADGIPRSIDGQVFRPAPIDFEAKLEL